MKNKHSICWKKGQQQRFNCCQSKHRKNQQCLSRYWIYGRIDQHFRDLNIDSIYSFLFLYYSTDWFESRNSIQYKMSSQIFKPKSNRLLPVIIGVCTVTWLNHHLLKVAWRSITYLSTYYILYIVIIMVRSIPISQQQKKQQKQTTYGIQEKNTMTERPTDRPVPDLKYGLAGHKTPGTDGATLISGFFL